MDIRLGLISAYSFLYGVHKPEALLDKAVSFGVKTVSICDINNLYGLHSFLEAAKERNIRAVIGATLSWDFPTSCRLYCFAENRSGFSRLCQILSIRSEIFSTRNKDTKNFNPVELLLENSSGLVLASTSSFVLTELAGNVKHLYKAITPDDLGGLGFNSSHNLPLCFLDTSAFLQKSDLSIHKTLRAIGLNKTIGSLAPSDTIPEGKCIFKSSTELAGIF